MKEEYGGYWYKAMDQPGEGWVYPALFRYIDVSPASLYVRAEPGGGRYEPSEIPALKERIEEIEQIVGRLTLKDESLRKGRRKCPSLRSHKWLQLTAFDGG